MGFINEISAILNMLIGALFLSMLLLFGLYFYFVKMKKVTSRTAKIDYTNFKKVDSLEYVKFDDIVSSNPGDFSRGSGMLVCGNNTFVGAIEVTGYNYVTASASEKEHTMISSIGFMNVIEDPVQLRQSTKAIDLEHNLDVHNKIIKDLARDITNLNMDYSSIVTKINDLCDEPELAQPYIDKAYELRKNISCKKWQLNEAQAVKEYMERLSKNQMGTQRVNTISFTYQYNAENYSEAMTKEEIYITAMQELALKAQTYSMALERCGCVCKSCTAEDLINLCRRHYSPYSADDIKLEELFNSSYNSLFVTSDSLIEMEMERVGEENLKKELDEYEKKMKQLLQTQKLAAERSERIIQERVTNLVSSNNAVQGGEI